MDAQTSLKKHQIDSHEQGPPVKRVYHEKDLDHDEAEKGYLVLHRVVCSKTLEGHADHSDALFLDVPKLYAGDSKAHPIRGHKPFLGSQENITEDLDVSFLVTKSYSCSNYHESLKIGFEPVQIPKVTSLALSKIRPFLYSLVTDGPLAEPNMEAIAIKSKTMSRSMALVEEKLPAYFANWQSLENLQFPYLKFFHGRKLLEELCRQKLDPGIRPCLVTLKNYILTTCKNVYEEADALFAKGLVNRAHLDKLFGPDEIIVTRKDDTEIGMLLSSRSGPNIYPLLLNCWSWTFDGLFRKTRIKLEVRWPAENDAHIPISELVAFPLRLDKTGLRERLESRGRTSWECRKQKFISYHAPLQSYEIQTSFPRYMVDLDTYRRMHSKEELGARGPEDLSHEAMEADEPPSYPFLLLLPAKVQGFGFHDKKWRSLFVEYIRPVQWNQRAFERVVLKSTKKELIKALVTIHLSGSQAYDVIDDKGQGLIMLFHGGPGTGKTLTAESIADLAEKPLYRVTCGDIGITPEEVEKYLDSVLYVGAIWGCVVLLDEADVFLEARTQNDLTRNALVSVFLRVLEYYQGILILTTNRIGTFDEAFKSRVQLPVHYPDLDDIGREAIWGNFIDSLAADRDAIEVQNLKNKIRSLARHKLNGRQIRNTIKTARQLAQYKREPLDYGHFETALEAVAEFEHYLLQTHGHTDNDFARHEGVRF